MILAPKKLLVRNYRSVHHYEQFRHMNQMIYSEIRNVKKDSLLMTLIGNLAKKETKAQSHLLVIHFVQNANDLIC